MRESINTITIENISHAYRDDESVLRNVNAIFEKGDSISIMGTSGVGKTRQDNWCTRGTSIPVLSY